MRVIGVLLLAVLTACSGGTDEPNGVDARLECERFAEDRLKAPSTADFDLTASGSGNLWTVTGTVDAENGFGAKIRSDVTCELRFSGEQVYLEDFSLS